MLRAFLLSVEQLGDPPVLRALAKSLGMTLAILAALGTLLWWGMRAALMALAGSGAGSGAASATGGIAVAAAVAATLLASWLLFRAIAIAVMGLFADEVVEAVEARHYPALLAVARPLPFARGLAAGLRSAVRVVFVNLMLLPVYVLLLATGIGTAAAFFLVNAWLLGRDLGDMVAVRHLADREVAAWRTRTAGARFALGLVAAGLLTIPFVNLLAPLLGAAMATHLFHGTRA